MRTHTHAHRFLLRSGDPVAGPFLGAEQCGLGTSGGTDLASVKIFCSCQRGRGHVHGPFLHAKTVTIWHTHTPPSTGTPAPSPRRPRRT